MARTTRASMTAPLTSSRTALLVGVASIMDLTGRTTVNLLPFRSVRATAPTLVEAVHLVHAVKYGQLTGFISALVVIGAAGVLVYHGYTALPVSTVLAHTVTIVTVSLYVDRAVDGRVNLRQT